MLELLRLLSFLALTAYGALATSHSCDYYAQGGTPCVAAHSSTRALYGNYHGCLYQVVRDSDKKTLDVDTMYTGGPANTAPLNGFCANTSCYFKILYDQSGRGNHLTAAPPGGAARGPGPNGYDNMAQARIAPVTIYGGKQVYGVKTGPGEGYRIDHTNGVARGDAPEGIYAVFDGTDYNSNCCYDYGNAESNNTDNGKTHMEAVYFGSAKGTVYGEGNGPWIQADLENGLFAGGEDDTLNPNNPSITYRFVTAIVKGASNNYWSIRGGNAQSGNLATFYAGQRPPGYAKMNKEGSIILGIGGDNSDGAQGTFYEGVMTSGYPSDATENKVQADIVAAGYKA